MSKNSAKTRSEGDADSTYADVSPNACSNSSSFRNVEGGPYGDIPPESNKQGIYKDYVVFMLQNNECSTETSEYSDNDDQELYSLRNEYLQKLNIVRKRLNLGEISESEDKYFSNDFNKKCTITEIIEEDNNENDEERVTSIEPLELNKAECSNQKHVKSEGVKNHDASTIFTLPKIRDFFPKKSDKFEQQNPALKDSNSSGSSGSVEIQTLHPFSVCYNKGYTESISNLLEIEYNPPKKKSCFRISTPKLPSASESNIPYHTKVSLHDGLFKKSAKKHEETKTTDRQLSTAFLEKFTVTREIQCNESEFESEHEFKVVECKKNATNIKNVGKIQSFSKYNQTRSVSSTSTKNCPLFPEVIVKYESPRKVIISSASSLTASSAIDKETSNFNHPNFIEDSSPESYNTVTTSTTIVKESIYNKQDRKMLNIKRKPKLNNVWQELRTLHYKNKGEVDAVLKEKDRPEQTKKKKKTFVQYITYRKDKKRPKSTPIKIKTQVPFGPLILHDYENIQNVDSKFYLFNSTSSEEEKYARELYTGKFDTSHSSDIKVGKKRSWSGLFSCFESLVSIFKRNN